MDTEKAIIVLVDDDSTSLMLGKTILMEKYNVVTIPSGEKLFKLLNKEKFRPSLILLDVEMPEMDGFETLRELKSREKDADIPVIFLTSKNEPANELEGLSLGAIDYISKPFSPPLLLKRLDVHLLVESQKQKLIDFNNNLQEMVRAKTKTVLDMQNSVLRTVANMVENRDEETGGHIERTQEYLRILLDAMTGQGLYQDEVASWDRDFFLQSSQLHDVGKISIKDSILLKPGRLDSGEFEEMKKHTTYGVRIVEGIEKNTPESSFLFYAKIFAGTHHEKWDGTGYPGRLKGEGIPLMGRLMAIADVYDALISERPYKTPFSHEETIKIIMEGKGTQFDPVLTDLFLSVADQFHEIVRRREKSPVD